MDKNAIPSERNSIDDSYIQLRQKSLAEKLYEAQTSNHNKQPICFVGTFNKIVESLKHAHPDVFILTGHSAKSAASETVISII